MSVKITYKGNEIASSSADETKTLKTSGKYCEGDIIVTNKQDGGITPTGTIEITENGTYDVTDKASAEVNVAGGEMPDEYCIGGSLSQRTLTDYHFGTGITKIYEYMFEYCLNLTSITIPEGITVVGKNAFYQCGRLTEILLPSTITRLEAEAFNSCPIGSIDLPEGLVYANSAFSGCKKLTSLTFPSTMKTLDGWSCYNCTALTNVLFKSTMTGINSGAFKGCNALTDIKVPWSEGDVANAPWGATNATITYNYTGE